MKKFYLIYNCRDGYRVVSSEGRVVVGKAYGSIIPYWDNGQELACYEQIEATGSRTEMVEELKKRIFFTASHRGERRKKPPVGERRKRVGA